MIITVQDWQFDVDLTATMAYSAAEAADHCTCGYCRNFYLTVDSTFPGLRPFLARFGVDVEAPEEMIAGGTDRFMDCQICYGVVGRVLKRGSASICVDGIPMRVESPGQAQIDCRCPEPCFILSTGWITFPWVLDEALEEVVSPANEPSFLEKAIRKLFRGKKKGPYLS